MGFKIEKLFLTIELVAKSWKNDDEDKPERWPYSHVSTFNSSVIIMNLTPLISQNSMGYGNKVKNIQFLLGIFNLNHSFLLS